MFQTAYHLTFNCFYISSFDRVQTCFTPKQRYMTRYRQVEECCSGWSEDGSGKCTVR